jgi:hypothetical protein
MVVFVWDSERLRSACNTQLEILALEEKWPNIRNTYIAATTPPAVAAAAASTTLPTPVPAAPKLEEKDEVGLMILAHIFPPCSMCSLALSK